LRESGLLEYQPTINPSPTATIIMPILTVSTPTLRLITLLPLLFLFFSSASVSLAEDRAVVRKEGSSSGKRVALVIGNSSYKVNPLTNPVNDATDMAALLKRLGFTVTLKTNAGKREMKEVMAEFAHSLQKSEIGLFYYSGHGIQVENNYFLIPVDAEVHSESDVKSEAVDAGRILGKMKEAGNKLNIVIFDAGHNNSFAQNSSNADVGIAKMDAPAGALVAHSTAPGSVAMDGKGRNGLYTQYLLQQMGKPGLKIEEVFKQVRMEVMSASGNQQVPWMSSNQVPSFSFTD
jgi:uncharacterized caspase-like protein